MVEVPTLSKFEFDLKHCSNPCKNVRNRQEMDVAFFCNSNFGDRIFFRIFIGMSDIVQKCSKVKVHTKSDVIDMFLYREWLLSLAKPIHTESSQSHWPSQSIYYRGPKMLHFDKSGRIGTHRVSGQENFRWRKFWSNKKPSSISCRFRTLLFASSIEAQTRLHIYLV